ncbi:MAG: BON domain-containing protein [Pseudomonas sp.]|uniref:BON domain-containing protein n=1 Tax=Pseudomonas sp. TaxID=306 RepID=UPI002736D922|nr:BON domain-containing protein [Pseudomonas sp.]MDP3846792.1 BON domain-containing protein [Pseudomonas sp.]
MYTQPRKLFIATGIALSIAALSTSAVASTAEDITAARQEAQIWTTYTLSPYLSASDLTVSVRAGKATLTGKVDEEVNKDLAKQIALGVSGIKAVDNQIVVQSDYRPKPSAEGGYADTVGDAGITTAIKSKLLWSKFTDGQTTEVQTNAGKVTLSGTAQSEQAKALAGRMALNTRGVTAVNNKLLATAAKSGITEQAKSTTAKGGSEIADSWITTKVKSTYLYSSNVSGADIEVTTKAGVVTLGGKLSNGAERALVVELADNVRGVKSVNAKALTF